MKVHVRPSAGKVVCACIPETSFDRVVLALSDPALPLLTVDGAEPDEHSLLEWREAGDPDDAPIVCPGCYAVGDEKCAPDCIDAEIAREREDYDPERDANWHDEFGDAGDDDARDGAS